MTPETTKFQSVNYIEDAPMEENPRSLSAISSNLGSIVSGSIAGRDVETIAEAINANGNLVKDLINAKLNTSTKQILDGFRLTASGALNISGSQTALTAGAAIGATSITVADTTGFPTAGVLYLQGNTNWMRITYTGKTGTTFTGIPSSSTGSITEAADSAKQVIGGPGIIITPKGLVTINSSGVETIVLEGSTGDATFAGTLSASGGTLGIITAGEITTTRILIKRPGYQNTYFCSSYESLDGWNVSYTGTNGSVVASICYLDLRPGDEATSIARISSEFGGEAINWTNDDPVIETILKHTFKQHSHFWFSLGQYTPESNGNQMGFYWKRTAGCLYAVWGKVGAYYLQQITGIDVNEWHKYRVEKAGLAIYFYVDNVLKYTATENLPSGDDDMILVLTAITTDAGENEVLSKRILLSKD